ncbi:hypothetical protein TWF506_006166 [Arthrobotrys conoides]|uniref:Uncharacterized protein n=1 Tax=Arthrobotrys conoides TaxID=74498 RepID=A0AAN8RTX4_9PEZI
MQFRLVTVVLALTAGALAQDYTAKNGTNTTSPPVPTPTDGSGAISNVVGMGSLALAVAGVVAAVF